ncbi:MAG TPA: nitroreductase family protein [Burkholderiaceae bacterium]|nr:nitroreductase family protein [Burkholderiaceae bacterium]
MAATTPAALGLLLSRQSVGIKHLVEPGPGDADLATMCQAALRAPDHGALVPFRLAVVRGAAREALARLFEAAGRAQGKAVTVAVLARIDLGHPTVPAHEQWACIGGALTNLLNAAHALGFGGKMLSGAKVRDADVQRAFCRPGETLIGWIALGTPAASPARAPVKPAVGDVMREWPGSVAGGDTPG